MEVAQRVEEEPVEEALSQKLVFTNGGRWEKEILPEAYEGLECSFRCWRFVKLDVMIQIVFWLKEI